MSQSHKDDRERMRERLEDPGLLDRAVIVSTGAASNGEHRSTRLAVPVGGSRRAGELTLANWEEALTALIRLDERPGFPNLRKAHPLGPPDHSQTVRWGSPGPERDPFERGRSFGYTEAGAAAYAEECLTAS
ncbi:DUF6302 family protein [Streptomyces sp. NPDC021622]|uniref:DUF6302 family protein n=1 Tax=Streptomyces sp. NPDC021622 TaxID=3155013 RepID=UPI0033D76338